MKFTNMLFIILLSMMFVSNADAGLIGDWSFDEGSGQWAYNAVDGQPDLRRGSSDSTWQDPEWTTDGCSGGALQFYSAPDLPDGNLDLLRPTSTANLSAFNTSSFTIEAWIKLDAIPANTFDAYNPFTIVSFGGTEGTLNKDAYFLRVTQRASDSSGILNGYFYASNGTGVSIIHSAHLQVGQWYHVGYSYDSTKTTNNISIWVNGVEETASSSLLPRTDLTITGESLAVGAMWNRSRGFNGVIDELKIYNSAVAIPEPASLAIMAAAACAGLISRRKMNK